MNDTPRRKTRPLLERLDEDAHEPVKQPTRDQCRRTFRKASE
jgi:hypothetical protein